MAPERVRGFGSLLECTGNLKPETWLCLLSRFVDEWPRHHFWQVFFVHTAHQAKVLFALSTAIMVSSPRTSSWTSSLFSLTACALVGALAFAPSVHAEANSEVSSRFISGSPGTLTDLISCPVRRRGKLGSRSGACGCSELTSSFRQIGIDLGTTYSWFVSPRLTRKTCH